MAFSTSLKPYWPFALGVFFCSYVSVFQLGKAENSYGSNTAAAGVLGNEYLPGQGGINQDYPEPGSVETNPDHIVAQALLCFNEKQIYSSCSESYRLSQKGELNVPPENVDQYCNGPCVSETDLVLSCIEGLLYSFKFYNRASINDVRETIKSGCGYGPKRGNFNVAEHIQDDYSHANAKNSNSNPLVLLLCGVVLATMARRRLLL